MLHRHNRTQTATVAAPPVAAGIPAAGIPAARTVEAPPIVQESVRYDRVTEVQPVIHRTVDQVHVHHIEKHIMSESAPSMGGSYERPALVQDHINHRYVTEVHPVYHGPSVQYEETSRTVDGPLQPLQQGMLMNQGHQFIQPNSIQANSFAAPMATQQVAQQAAYLPQQQTVASTGFVPAPAAGNAYTSAAQPVARGRHHHIFHRPTNADGRF